MVGMVRRVVIVLADMVLVFAGLFLLAGCGGGLPDPEETSGSSADAAMEQAASDCLDIWLNTKAPQSVINAGLTPTSDGYRPAVPVITALPDGLYHADTSSAPFAAWCEHNPIPWTTITGSILHGQGCPFEEPS